MLATATTRPLTLKSDACFHLTKRSSVPRTPEIGPRYAPLMRQLSRVRTRLTWSSACGPRAVQTPERIEMAVIRPAAPQIEEPRPAHVTHPRRARKAPREAAVSEPER